MPEAQLDRFLVKIVVDYPSREETIKMLKRLKTIEEWPIKPVAGPEDVALMTSIVWDIYVDDKILGYIADIIEETRKHPYVRLGGSPRAAIAMLQLSRAIALINGRDYVIPDDVKKVAMPVLVHRVILKPEAELEGITPENVIDDVLKKVPVP